MSGTGDTSTSQMSQEALAIRFLERTQTEVAQMAACLPDTPTPFALEPAAIAHIQRMAQKISSAAEAFGFPEIDTIAAGIELLTQDGMVRTVRQRLELAAVLVEKISTLQVYVEFELAEKDARRVPQEVLPLSAHIPGFRVRRK